MKSAKQIKEFCENKISELRNNYEYLGETPYPSELCKLKLNELNNIYGRYSEIINFIEEE